MVCGEKTCCMIKLKTNYNFQYIITWLFLSSDQLYQKKMHIFTYSQKKKEKEKKKTFARSWNWQTQKVSFFQYRNRISHNNIAQHSFVRQCYNNQTSSEAQTDKQHSANISYWTDTLYQKTRQRISYTI